MPVFGSKEEREAKQQARMEEARLRQQAQEQERLAREAKEEQERLAQEQEQLAKEAYEKKRNQATKKMLVTSGFNFDGYTVTKYGPHIASDDVYKEEMRPGFWSAGLEDQGGKISDALMELRRKTLQELKEKAYDLGCNAITGLDFSYTTLGPFNTNTHHGSDARNNLAYYIFLTYKGNAVVIEKN